MARYADIDKFMQNLKTNEYGETSITEIGLALEKARADVVSRVEFDELIYKLECLLCHATGGRLSKHTYDLQTMETIVTDYIDESYTDGVNDGEKVAREIFSELDTLVNLLCTDNDDKFIYSEMKKKYLKGGEQE